MNTELVNLIQYEKEVKDFHVLGSVDAIFSFNNQILIKADGKTFVANLNRPIIHQLARRIWPHVKDNFEHLQKEWKHLLRTKRTFLMNMLRTALNSQDIVIRYRESGSTCEIYGIVSSHFVKIDLLEFRSQLFKTMSNFPAFEHIESRSYRTFSPNTLPFEVFSLRSNGFELKTECLFFYARNNGYSAFKATWGRWILVCSNGLSLFKGNTYTWRHNQRKRIEDFIEETINFGYKHLQLTQESIERGRNTILNEVKYQSFLDRLNVAVVTKEDVKARFEQESKEVGRNEWALSQALTWLGTHHNSLTYRVRSYLRDVGTQILDNTLTAFLAKDTEK